MQSKHPKLERSDQVVWSLEDDVSGVHGGGKYYTCSFCKKGFSNAQALGGHMNIHRKDRAKLRESSEGNILSLDIVKTTTNNVLPPDHDDDHHQVSEIILESSDEEKCSSPKRPCKLIPSASPRGKHGFEQLKQYLPLFVDGSGGESLRLIHHGSTTTTTSQIELDLELRLGPDSRASSGSAK